MTRALKLAIVVAVLVVMPANAQLVIPEIPYDAVDPLKLPDDLYLGEAVGVATNSKGNIFVYTRTGNPSATLGTRRTFSRGAARLFEFDPSGKYIREIGQGLYGFLFAHTVRIDRQDNIWVVDEGSNMVIKFDIDGRVLMTMGRKPEAIPVHPPPPPPPAPAAPGAWRTSRLPPLAPACQVTTSTARPTSPGMQPATSTWPTATGTRASRNSTGTAST